MDSFLRRKTREEANEQDPYTVAIVKEQLGIEPKQLATYHREYRQHVHSLFLQRSGNIKCRGKMLFFRFITRQTRGDLYIAAGGFFIEKYLNNAISLATCYYIKA